MGDPLTLLIHMKSEKGECDRRERTACESAGENDGSSRHKLARSSGRVTLVECWPTFCTARVRMQRRPPPTETKSPEARDLTKLQPIAIPSPNSRLRHSCEKLRRSQWRQAANAAHRFKWVSPMALSLTRSASLSGLRWPWRPLGSFPRILLDPGRPMRIVACERELFRLPKLGVTDH